MIAMVHWRGGDNPAPENNVSPQRIYLSFFNKKLTVNKRKEQKYLVTDVFPLGGTDF